MHAIGCQFDAKLGDNFDVVATSPCGLTLEIIFTTSCQ